MGNTTTGNTTATATVIATTTATGTAPDPNDSYRNYLYQTHHQYSSILTQAELNAADAMQQKEQEIKRITIDNNRKIWTTFVILNNPDDLKSDYKGGCSYFLVRKTNTIYKLNNATYAFSAVNDPHIRALNNLH